MDRTYGVWRSFACSRHSREYPLDRFTLWEKRGGLESVFCWLVTSVMILHETLFLIAFHYDILWHECGCPLSEKQYPCPLDTGLVFISRLHCREFSFCQCNRLCGYSLVFYGKAFLVLGGRAENWIHRSVLANKVLRSSCLGRRAECCYLSWQGMNSNSFSPPFLLCLPYVEILMPHLTLRTTVPAPYSGTSLIRYLYQ